MFSIDYGDRVIKKLEVLGAIIVNVVSICRYYL